MAEITFRSPRQASRVFGLDQATFDGGLTTGGIPRPKFLFLARFIRGAGGGNASDWANGMTFAMKRMDRPKVQPSLSTLNQYNKKRVVHTGLKYSPVRFDFHDTVDAAVLRMWDEYSKYHFGDFRSANGSEWTYDVANKDFLNYGTGFGLTLPQGNSGNSVDRSAGFFFDRVECYQFFGGTYMQYDLIHPKIMSFDPDEMDYADVAGSHVVSMGMEYEAIVYHNSNVPAPIQNAAIYSELIANFFGDVYDPPNNILANGGKSGTFLDGIINQAAYLGSSILGNKASAAANKALGINSSTSVLNSFGGFNFGSVGNTIATSVVGGIQSNVGTSIITTTSSATSNITNSLLNTINSNRQSSSQIGVRTDSAELQKLKDETTII